MVTLFSTFRLLIHVQIMANMNKQARVTEEIGDEPTKIYGGPD